MKQHKQNPFITLLILALAALLSIGIITKYSVSPETHAKTIEALDEKKATVMKLTASASAASIAVAAVPGDATTPIANELAELNNFFVIALCAILLEKYLLTVVGYASFTLLIPAACAFFALYVFFPRSGLKKLGIKLTLLGICFFLVVPASVWVSDLIEHTYQVSSIVNVDEEAFNELAEMSMDGSALTETEPEPEPEKKGGFWSSVTDGLANIGTTVENATNAVTEAASAARQTAQETLNHFVEALAVMIVTTCLVPILTFTFFLWLIQTITGIDFELDPRKAFRGHGKHHHEPKSKPSGES